MAGIGAYGPPPEVHAAEPRAVGAWEPAVTGFVFKVQANMDPKHRDRVAFVRLCSGHFQRGMKLHHVRTGKPMAVANPVLFLAQDRELAEDAWAGDIIGIPNHGQLRIGDALTEGEAIRFTGIPSFAPELLQAVRAGDPMKSKHLEKALNQFAEEGASKLFKPQRRLRLDRRRRRPPAVRRPRLAASSRNTACRSASSRRSSPPPAGSPGRARRSTPSPAPTRATWPRTTTAIRST